MNMLIMEESNPILEPWIMKELVQLGIFVPKLKKMKQQIHKKSLKGKPCGVFGVCLLKLFTSEEFSDTAEVSQKVPCFLERMTKFLFEHTQHNCIFRKNGNSDRMKHLRENLEQGEDPPEGTSVEDAAGVLKAWFRDLPVPLIPQEYHELFFGCHKVCETSSSSKALLLACTLLPREHLATLKHIMSFLAQVAKHSTVNKMSAQSLAIVFAPNIMPTLDKHRQEKNISIEVLKEKQAKERDVIQWLIEHSEEVSNTPESVELLARLASRSPAHGNKKEQNRKQTKRRKSMCDIGTKIKKMVGPHSTNTHSDLNKASKGSCKRKAENCSESADSPTKRSKSKPIEVQTEQEQETPSRHLSNKMNQLNILSSNHKSPKIGEREKRSSCKPRRSTSLCFLGCSSKSAEYIEVTTDVPEHQYSDMPKSGFDSGQKVSHISSENQKTEGDFTEPTNSDTSHGINTEVKILRLAEMVCTPGNTESPNSKKSNLKRGRPNTITSGLRSAKRDKTRTNSVELATPCSELLGFSKRRSRSASSVYAHNISNDHFEYEKESSTPFRISRALNFTDAGSGEDLSSFNKFSQSSNTDNLLGTSLGFSPILNTSNGSHKLLVENQEWLSVNSNHSRNPFDDLTNGSEIPTLNSIGESSLYADVFEAGDNKNSNRSPLPVNFCDQDNFVTPSPIMSQKKCKSKKDKLSITASSTPSNSKISWKCAHTFDFNQKIPTDDVDGSKRESIVKLRQTNAGKVLANINLYDKKPIQPQPKGWVSPAGQKPNIFERNGFATKSVRERGKKFLDQQGFKVPSGCPSSIRRVTKNSKGFSSKCQTSISPSSSLEHEFCTDEKVILDSGFFAKLNKDLINDDAPVRKMNLGLEKCTLKPALTHSKMLF